MQNMNTLKIMLDDDEDVGDFLAFFREKQKLLYSQQEENMKKKKHLIHLKNLKYFIPKDLFNKILSYIPEYIITWFSDGTWTLMVNAPSLYKEYHIREYDESEYCGDEYDEREYCGDEYCGDEYRDIHYSKF